MTLLLLWLAFGALGTVVFLLGWSAHNTAKGYEAGAEAKTKEHAELGRQIVASEEAKCHKLITNLNREHAAAIKAERERVLEEVKQKFLKQAWCPDWRSNREYELMCEVKGNLLKAIQQLKEAQ